MTSTTIEVGFYVATVIAGQAVNGEVIGIADHDGRMIASIVINRGPLTGYVSLPCEHLTVIGKRLKSHWRIVRSVNTGNKDAIQLNNDFILQVRKAYGSSSPGHLEQFAAQIMDQLNDILEG